MCTMSFRKSIPGSCAASCADVATSETPTGGQCHARLCDGAKGSHDTSCMCVMMFIFIYKSNAYKMLAYIAAVQT